MHQAILLAPMLWDAAFAAASICICDLNLTPTLYAEPDTTQAIMSSPATPSSTNHNITSARRLRRWPFGKGGRGVVGVGECGALWCAAQSCTAVAARG